MPIFRNHTPSRRSNPRTVRRYQNHKDDLRADFSERCGYCDDTDFWKVTWFEIDHFVPKAFHTTLNETTYSNLVYSCRSCNNSKRKKWPTGREDIHNENDEGFIDPCNPLYAEQFERKNDGKISALTPLGTSMYKALSLYKVHHEVIWIIEKINPTILAIEELHSSGQLDNVPPETLRKIIRIQSEFLAYIRKLFQP